MDYQYVFVSDPLRKRLEESGFEDLRFTEDLDRFVGAETQHNCLERTRRLVAFIRSCAGARFIASALAD